MVKKILAILALILLIVPMGSAELLASGSKKGRKVQSLQVPLDNQLLVGKNYWDPQGPKVTKNIDLVVSYRLGGYKRKIWRKTYYQCKNKPVWVTFKVRTTNTNQHAGTWSTTTPWNGRSQETKRYRSTNLNMYNFELKSGYGWGRNEYLMDRNVVVKAHKCKYLDYAKVEIYRGGTSPVGFEPPEDEGEAWPEILDDWIDFGSQNPEFPVLLLAIVVILGVFFYAKKHPKEFEKSFKKLKKKF